MSKGAPAAVPPAPVEQGQRCAICASALSAVAIAEVGLAGEVRPVTGAHRRLAEAARLGFTRAVVPSGVLGAGPVPEGLSVLEVGTVAEAVGRALHDVPVR